ncbi:hypothetical protein CsSME_00015683 [Camellia sinensis var. sinensis]
MRWLIWQLVVTISVIVVEQLRELKGELKEEVDVVSGSNKFGSMSTQNASSSYGDGVLNSKESTTILDPIVVYQKGRPPYKDH